MKLPLVILMLSFAPLLAGTNEPAATPACCRPLTAPANYTDKSVFLLDSNWTTDAGQSVKLGSLRGRPQVVAMFFASCQFTCPLTVSDLQRIEAALPENLRTNTGFLLISFDSERDTPAVLQAYRARRELSPSNWTILRGDPDAVRELAALLGVIYRQDARGDFAHSNVITLLNAEGEIVFQQPGLNLPAEEMVARLQALTHP